MSQVQRVLIVDDEPNVSMVLAESLSGNYQVETANTPEDALSLLRQSFYQLMITDYKMPGMNGLDLAREARRISPDTQIVLMTAFGTEGLKDAAGKLNLEGYISKPFSIKQIRAIVEQAVSQAPHSQPVARQGEADTAAYKELQRLQADTGARCVILLSSSGYPIRTSGQTGGLDISSLSALVAANFLAAAELARLLGRGTVFKSSYHEGHDAANDNIYAYAIDQDYLLAVVFGAESKPGAVWFYTKQTASTLGAQFARRAPQAQPLSAAAAAAGDSSPALALDAPLLSLEEAVASGLLPSDFAKAGEARQKLSQDMDAIWGNS